MMTLVLKWVHLRSAEVVGVAEGMRMSYTMVVTLQNAQQIDVAVKTIFCFPGNIHCQKNSDQTNQENLPPLTIQLPMNFPWKKILIHGHQ